MKMPEPMMPPMTTIVASNGPSARRKPTRESLCDFTRPTWNGRRSGRRPRFDLAGSNVLSCTLDDLVGARDALLLSGSNDNGYQPLVDAIARRYVVRPDQVTTANGAAGANFQALAAVLEPGDDVLMERPGYDPLPGAARLLGANIVRFERRFEDGFALDPDAVARALTPRTRLVIITLAAQPDGRAGRSRRTRSDRTDRAHGRRRTSSSTRSISTRPTRRSSRPRSSAIRHSPSSRPAA